MAAAVMQMVEQGRVGLEDPVARHVPEFARLTVRAGAPPQREPVRPMTVAHLLTHRCVLGDSGGTRRIAPRYREAGLIAGAWMLAPWIGGLEGLAKRLAGPPLAFQPGSDRGYGDGLDIAGLIVERVAGLRLGEALGRQLFEPLGMTSTGFSVASDGARRLTGLCTTREGALQARGRRQRRCEASPFGPPAALLPVLTQFGRHVPGSIGQTLGGVVRFDDCSGPRSAGEYARSGAAGTRLWATPGLGLSVTRMTQLTPVAPGSARDALCPMVNAAPAAGG